MNIRSMLTLALGLTLLATTPVQAVTWSLVWSDEFDGTGLNSANWRYDVGNGCPSLCGWGNNELQYYRTENVAVSGGELIITSKRENYAGYEFTSGKIHSRAKQSFLYGRIEMRAKIPTGGGMWPAFWMMPESDVYGGWAASGEIDIMEAANNTTSVGGTLHFGGQWPNNTSTGGSYSLGGNQSFADDYHVYAVEWEPTEMRWYVDDVLYSTKTNNQWYTDAAPGNPLAPFDQEFYIILNTAVGGNYTGCTDPGCISADLPQEFRVDYVRVYQEVANELPQVTITAPGSGTTLPVGDILITADASDSDGSVVGVEFYNGTTFLGLDTSAPYQYLWSGVSDGCYQVVAKAVDNLGAEVTDTVDITVGFGCGQGPYGGSLPVVPVRLEAENFDVGGQSVAYNDDTANNTGGMYRPSEGVDIEACSDAGGGFNVGWVNPGEWLEYTVLVPTGGAHILDVRVASLSNGGSFHVEVGGVDLTGPVSFAATGGWQTWQTVGTNLNLNAGTNTIRFVAGASGFNLNWLELQRDIVSDVPDLAARGPVLYPNIPNPFNPRTTLSFELPGAATVTLAVHDAMGRLVRTLEAGRSLPAGRHESVWDGRDDRGRMAAAGVYFVRLDADNTVRTGRMTLIK